MSRAAQDNESLAQRLRAALEARDLVSLGTLLSDDVCWGDDDNQRRCRGRSEVLATFSRAIGDGAAGRIGELASGEEGILCELQITRSAVQEGDRRLYHVYLVRDGRISEIRRFDDRVPAAQAAGLAGSAAKIRALGLEEIEMLRGLWLELLEHERSLAPFGLQPDDELSWRVRSAQYRRAVEQGQGFVLAAFEAAVPVGYAAVFIHAGGPDDTFVLGPSYGELYSLVVAAGSRRAGLGSRLLGAVEDELARRGVGDLQLTVIEGNTEAMRFYERHGLQRAETVFWRFAAESTDLKQ